jgi:hypothetical protein
MAGELSPEKVQIISFHLGAVLTELVRKAGYDENTLLWDNSTSSLLNSILRLLEKVGILSNPTSLSSFPCLILRLGSH